MQVTSLTINLSKGGYMFQARMKRLYSKTVRASFNIEIGIDNSDERAFFATPSNGSVPSAPHQSDSVLEIPPQQPSFSTQCQSCRSGQHRKDI